MQTENWLIANDCCCEGWRFLKPLGRGGMGEVYAVEEQATGLRFAMKLNRAQTDTYWRQQFWQSGQRLINLAHPNICKLLRLGTLVIHDVPYDFILMTLVATTEQVHEQTALQQVETLQTRSLADYCDLHCSLSDTHLDQCYREGMAALTYLHHNALLHGDIKPANCLLDSKGHLVFVDFGLSALASQAPQGLLAGTPQYLAPEVIRGEAPTPAADLYAFGVTLFQVKTGFPYANTPACRLLLEDLAPLWKARLQALLHPDPAQRHWVLHTTPRLSRRQWLTGLATLLAGGIGGSAYWVLRDIPCVTGAIDLHEAKTLRWEPPFADELPPLHLSHGAQVHLPLRGGVWKFGETHLQSPSTLIVEGEGKLQIKPRPKLQLGGTIQVKAPASLSISCGGEGPRPQIRLEKGTHCTFTQQTNRKADQQFRQFDASKGGFIKAHGNRFYINLGCENPILLGNDAVFDADIVLTRSHFRATEGVGTLRGKLYPWHTTQFSAAEGATLRIESSLWMYDYWRGNAIELPPTSKGTVVFAGQPFVPLCAVFIEGGCLCIEQNVTQSVEGNWSQRRTTHPWHLRKDASLCGNATLAFEGDGTLFVDKGSIIEGGIQGKGTLNISKATLKEGAILRLPQAASLHIGNLTTEGPILLDLATTQGDRDLITWDTVHPNTPTFQTLHLPQGATLVHRPNGLALSFTKGTP